MQLVITVCNSKWLKLIRLRSLGLMLIRSCLQKLLLSLDDVNLGYVFGRIRERFVGGKCKI